MMNNGTWWVGPKDLDEDQSKIISLPIDESVLVTGPPGCGKTNLLLLRANYLFLSGFRNIVIVTYTRSLKDFISSGADKYDFPKNKIMTCREWQNDLLNQYDSKIELTGKFDKDRAAYVQEIESIITKYRITEIYDSILLDEAQDYSSKEIKIFKKLAERMFIVADERQKIYNGDNSLEEMKNSVKSTHALQYHYRNGLKICRVADEIAKGWQGYRPLTETSNYDERENPSTVDIFKCNSITDQVQLIITRLRNQIIAYPDQLIGILCPKKETMQIVWDIIMSSEYGNTSFLLHSSVNAPFQIDKNIVVSTFHAAKGLEFRSLHLVNCDELRYFGNNRRMSFTAVTRAKTSLSIYHMGKLHGYLESAIQSLDQQFSNPSLSDLFGGSR